MLSSHKLIWGQEEYWLMDHLSHVSFSVQPQAVRNQSREPITALPSPAHMVTSKDPTNVPSGQLSKALSWVPGRDMAELELKEQILCKGASRPSTNFTTRSPGFGLRSARYPKHCRLCPQTKP